MHSNLQGNVVHRGVELLLLVSMLFLLTIPKSLSILKEFLYYRYQDPRCLLDLEHVFPRFVVFLSDSAVVLSM